jgi:hypothetical protein
MTELILGREIVVVLINGSAQAGRALDQPRGQREAEGRDREHDAPR